MPRFKHLPAGTVIEINDPAASSVVEQESITVTGETLDTPRIITEYLIGSGDVLLVFVYGHPEMTLPKENKTSVKGITVDTGGCIQLPLVGSIQLAGLSRQQARDRIEDALKEYITEPSVIVEIAEYRSQSLYLLGQFKQPGTYYMDRSFNLLQGLAMGKGLDATANLRGARLLREKKLVAVDIYSLLHEGDQRQNIRLQSGDTIYVPDSSLQNVFVFGAVMTPGTIPMKNGQLFLHQAVAAAGGLRDNGYDENVRIIRSLSPTRGELIVVDLDRILAGEARPFRLMDGDIVYIPKSAIANWNEVISEILPSLRALGAMLNPFVQIKYLSD